jgi:hypothetical protein
VSIIAATACRYLYWQRSSLEYLLVKETYFATVLTTLIARDITTKLYAMNKKVRISSSHPLAREILFSDMYVEEKIAICY